MSFITPTIIPISQLDLESMSRLDQLLLDSLKELSNSRISRTSTDEWYKTMKQMIFKEDDFVSYSFTAIVLRVPSDPFCEALRGK